ncbi:MAG: ABC transporter permease [Candidatus Jettenia sp.]|uniref:Uncharacterized protein n=1 Tax=Candidatus Jettenia caeni TaxID=247490 RepID=I3IR58_9BACT|nr:ABC transporter permease [Candidatus Jettenia sp. AMX1]MBC6928559.1 ABC transporter permease [Candidatus Jettenia sp.]WKZ15612.1 MAG: ABC transporter permease [Candidatus Jettenia caeni]KAA0249181.1 MAG: ABC transporter permease [Candidatus Jettenia sp. AMX1]MCE7879778.1 ABC transporter permease [Candidatus Jettenia sp. AMX1]MCQ3926459.1 ABC transporter permease [Candidatus Jettenia sp.]
MIKKIVTIAHGTLTEFIRNRIFFFLVIFGLIIGGISSALPAMTSEDKIKLILRATITMVGLFSTLLIIYFIATSIYKDIEEKTIYTVFSRPTSRFVYLSGKAAGFFAIGFIIVFMLSGITLAYLMTIHGKSLAGTNIFRPVKYLKGKGPVIVGEAANLELISTGGRLIGDGSYAVWAFHDLDRVPFQGEKADISLKIGGVNAGTNAGSAFVGVDVLDAEDKSLQATHYAYVGNMNPDTRISIDRTIIEQNKRIKVKVFPSGKGYYIAPQKGDVAFLLRNQCSFYSNYFRSFGFVFFLVSLLSVITLSAASYFGQKMALVISFFAYITGNTLPYLKSFGNLIGMKSIEEMQAFIPGHGHLHQAETYSKLPKYLTDGAHIITLKKIIFYFSSAFPDFKRFDPTGYFLQGTYIDNIIFLKIIAYTAFYGIPFMLLAWLCFWKRELISR